MSETPYNFAGPGAISSLTQAAGDILTKPIDMFLRHTKTQEKIAKIQNKGAGRVESFANATSGGGTPVDNSEHLRTLGEVVGNLMDKSAGHDINYAKAKGQQRRLTTNNNIRQFGKLNAKPGTRVTGTLGRKGAVTATFTQAPAPAVKKAAPKKATAKPQAKAAAPKAPVKKTVAPKGAAK